MERVGLTATRINHFISEINAAYHEYALKMGLTDSEAMILYTVCYYGDSCLLRDIVKLSGINKQTINSALRKMEKNGFVILREYNGRNKSVHLTESGKALAERTVAKEIQIENEIYQEWTQAEQDLFVALMQRYSDAFKRKTETL